ncbi:MAG: heme A synthase [Rhodoluna sp.]|nr:heme A synthase [Rhodoluna sp.]MBP6186602.1 heme A synthase [Rhodoluna sp.]
MFLFASSKVRLYAWLSLASQILIVVTGGAVRLTASGLGCPTWPMCTEDSLVNVPEQGIHGFIEFANRLLTYVLILIALLTFITIMRLGKDKRHGLVWPALAAGLGIFAQAIVGGISVLTNLNPWVVGLHFVVSAALIAITSILVWRVYANEHVAVPYRAYWLAPSIWLFGFVTLLIGVVVTGAGPHAGDADAPRNGLPLEILQHWHSYPAYVLLALSFASLLVLRRVNVDGSLKLAVKINTLLVVALIAQAVLGIAQARLGVPPLLVGLHMLGASVIASLLTFQWLVIRGK